MKRRDLEKALKENGWEVIREGGRHTIWGNKKGVQEPVPRHNEINEKLAKKIIKKSEENPGRDSPFFFL